MRLKEEQALKIRTPPAPWESCTPYLEAQTKV
jgi:hypothetical protein